MSAELEKIWSRIQAELVLAVDEATYRIWLEPLRASALSEGVLVVEAPPQACGWIRDRFGRALQSAAERVLGLRTLVNLVPSQGDSQQPAGRDLKSRGQRQVAARFPSAPSGWSRSGATRARAHDHPSLGDPLANPKLTFSQFVIGDCNRLAHAAALAVAEMPTQAYNPLFICGPPGVGKTHLLSAIGSLLLCHSPGLTVRRSTGEAFTNAFLNALGDGQTDEFKTHFRHIDVLLMDDIQFLERKAKTEEEFFHTFNALYDSGRQIVLTSDRPPADLQALEERLRERFQAGLVADIAPPDLPTRLAILHKRVEHDRVDLADERALEVLADHVTSNVRALEGMLIRAVAFSSLTGRPLNAELVHQVLALAGPAVNHCGRTAGPTSIAQIQAAVCEYFDLSREDLLAALRSRRVAWPRQLAMYLARELTDESLPAIGRHFGGRDHTTVLHAWRRAQHRLKSNVDAREALNSIHAQLKAERLTPRRPQAGLPSVSPQQHDIHISTAPTTSSST